MTILTYTELRDAYPLLDTRVIQALGVEPDGRPLAIDGAVGPKTRGASFLDPDTLEAGVLDFAMQELLERARESDGLNNAGPRVAKYYERPYVPRKKYGAWCAAFASWCLRQAYGTHIKRILGAQRLGRAIAKHHSALGKLEAHELEAGDLIIWDRDGPDEGRDPSDDWHGHVGFVAHVDDAHIWTIEGNRRRYPAPVRVFRYPKDQPDMRGGPFLFGARYQEEE